MSKRPPVVNVDGEYNFPRGFTISDNRIEDMLQRHLSPTEYVVWRQYLRFWGSNKKKAYPSLSYLSTVTGLSEKTIRKSNKELSRKKFLTYVSGCPGRSNLYTYQPIEKIIKYYYGSEDAKDVIVQDEPTPIREVDPGTTKVESIFDKLSNKDSIFVNAFIERFREDYKSRYGYDYELDDKDAKELVDRAAELTNVDLYINLIDTFFKTRNSYIEKSDRSIYFFFRPTVMKAVISEYNDSDVGRWDAQAARLWEKLEKELKNQTPKDIEEWVVENTHLGGANKKRDNHVIAILVKRVREYLES